MSEELDWIDRTIQEIEAISIIYDSSDGGDLQEKNGALINFSILSNDEYEFLKNISVQVLQKDKLCQQNNELLSLQPIHVQIEILIRKNDMSSQIRAVSQITLPRGYPTKTAAAACVISVDTLSRSQREDISVKINEKAKLMLGSEMLMDLIQEFQNELMDKLSELSPEDKADADDFGITKGCRHDTSNIIFSRRWIWVHHITDNSRCKNIVQEARNYCLGGFLKSGYPGVVVIEGPSNSCDEFVSWIKGNKSRPNGFGRNWGHHVRGQIDGCDLKIMRSGGDLIESNSFTQLGEDLKELGEVCKEVGIEDEFLAYVMQH